MAKNIFQESVTPDKPKSIANQQINVYVPKASNDSRGIASFNDPYDAFIVNEGNVLLNRLNRDAFIRPDLVMLNTDDFIANVENDKTIYSIDWSDINAEISRIKDDIIRLDGRIDDVIVDYTDKIDAVKGDLVDLSEAVDALDEKYDGALDDIDERLDGIDDSIESLDGRLDEVEDFIEHLDTGFVNVQETYGTITSTILNGNGVISNTVNDSSDNSSILAEISNSQFRVAVNGTNRVIIDNNGLKFDGNLVETIDNKSTVLNNSSTNTQYPTSKAVYDALHAIDILIPSEATSENQLADKNFVNSSIATNTSNFIGTFSSVAELEDYSGTVTNNDYAVVTNGVVTDNGADWASFAALDAKPKSMFTNYDYAWVINGSKFDLYRFDIVLQQWDNRATNINKTDVSLITAYNRYKYNGILTEWVWEYTVNNSGFTAAQWAAINSGITASLVNQLESVVSDLPYIVTTNTAQTITGKKTIDAEMTFTNSSAAGTNNLTIKNDNGYNTKIKMGSTENMRLMTGGTYFGATAGVTIDNSFDLGASSAAWKDFYLKGKIALDNYIIDKDNFGQLQIRNANTTSMQFDGSTVRAQNVVPMGNNQKDLGSSSMQWKDLYLAGNLTDGTNTIAVANIASKSEIPTNAVTLGSETQTFQSSSSNDYNKILEASAGLEIRRSLSTYIRLGTYRPKVELGISLNKVITMTEIENNVGFTHKNGTSTTYNSILQDKTGTLALTSDVDAVAATVPEPMSEYEVQDICFETLYTSYTITTTVTNGTYVGNAVIAVGKTSEVIITPNTGYTLPLSVTVTGATSSYNSTTGKITLSNVTGNTTISATCVAE